MRRVLSLGVAVVAVGCATRVETIGDLGDGASSQAGDSDGSSVCLVQYNQALVGDGEPTCCYYSGGASECDVLRACSASSGSDCCVLYATSATPMDGACCLYADGRTPLSATGNDISAECKALVGRSARPADCLLQYNGALVAEGEDVCCYHVNGQNGCDLARACNEQSGPDCCVLYAGAQAPVAGACCLFANRRAPTTGGGADATDLCNALLN